MSFGTEIFDSFYLWPMERKSLYSAKIEETVLTSSRFSPSFSVFAFSFFLTSPSLYFPLLHLSYLIKHSLAGSGTDL